MDSYVEQSNTMEEKQNNGTGGGGVGAKSDQHSPVNLTSSSGLQQLISDMLQKDEITSVKTNGVGEGDTISAVVPPPLKIHKTEIGRCGSLKAKGTPNSSVDLKSGEGKMLQRRFYGEDGKVILDIVFSHGNGDGTHIFPHKHIWIWEGEKPSRQRGEMI